MGTTTGLLDVIKQAQLGSRESMATLAQLARGKIFVYIYRLTLNYDLSQDLTQETMLEMISSLKRLKQTNRFWPWLYRTALGKVQHHFRSQGNRRIERRTIFDGGELLRHVPEGRQSGLNKLLQKELSQVVLKALSQMKLSYRSVLTLRCFDQMSYTEIAAITGSTEVQTRLLFFRAKQALRKQLAWNGFEKKHLLSALGLFGTITAFSTKSTSAATTISAAATKVGLTTAIVGTVTTKSGAAIAAATVALAITVGGGSVLKHFDKPKIAFEYPTSVVRADDPNGNGWKGVRGSTLVTVRPDALVGFRPDNENTPLVILPNGYSLELRFPGTIVDGTGNDIEFISKITGNQPRVFLTDGSGLEYQLGDISQIKRVGLWQVSSYEISGLEIPFEPCAVRLEGVGSQGPWRGAALFNIKARVRR